jgi:hypothetical protein
MVDPYHAMDASGPASGRAWIAEDTPVGSRRFEEQMEARRLEPNNGVNPYILCFLIDLSG